MEAIQKKAKEKTRNLTLSSIVLKLNMTEPTYLPTITTVKGDMQGAKKGLEVSNITWHAYIKDQKRTWICIYRIAP